MENICVQFAFAFCRHNIKCNDKIEAFIRAGNEFKKKIKSLHISRRKEGDLRRYLFTDDSLCIYNMKENYFKFRSPLKQTICTTQAN